MFLATSHRTLMADLWTHLGRRAVHAFLRRDWGPGDQIGSRGGWVDSNPNPGAPESPHASGAWRYDLGEFLEAWGKAGARLGGGVMGGPDFRRLVRAAGVSKGETCSESECAVAGCNGVVSEASGPLGVCSAQLRLAERALGSVVKVLGSEEVAVDGGGVTGRGGSGRRGGVGGDGENGGDRGDGGGRGLGESSGKGKIAVGSGGGFGSIADGGLEELGLERALVDLMQQAGVLKRIGVEK